MTGGRRPAAGPWGDPERVRRVAGEALRRRGVTAADEIVATLVETSLLGVHTHGIRLLAAFLDELDRGVADPAAEPAIAADSGPVVRLDARRALGVLAGLRAAGLAAERADRYGVGVVGVNNSNHFGAAGHYARQIAAAGHLAVVTTSAASRVAPFGGVEPLFGTNPLAVAYGPEFCLDMATSQVCFNEIKERRRAGRPLEHGWAVDADGRGTTAPDEATALSPLGGYKGQGLAMAVTMLTAVLVGGALDAEMEHDRSPVNREVYAGIRGSRRVRPPPATRQGTLAVYSPITTAPVHGSRLSGHARSRAHRQSRRNDTHQLRMLRERMEQLPPEWG
ncbi:hypothetical protein GCM10009827_105050 [Dactylosporangium maewongense]|uniref:Ldh family oxidoreductase n=1 Tax=Dactylosporangium maewongense TaxID=634393 RepID=A0ABN2CZS2_9ACTN